MNRSKVLYICLVSLYLFFFKCDTERVEHSVFLQLPEGAKEIYRAILAKKGWASFGHIAAEADISRM